MADVPMLEFVKLTFAVRGRSGKKTKAEGSHVCHVLAMCNRVTLEERLEQLEGASRESHEQRRTQQNTTNPGA